MSNDIKKLLRIIEPNLITSDISYEMVKGQQTCVVNATFSPPLMPCHHCGSTVYNESGKQIVVRNGKKKVVVRFDQFNHLPLIMNVAKQRYTCKNCAHHWAATPYFVEKGHSISRHVILKIIDLLKEKISFTLIAKLCHVSITTVIRVFRSIKSYLPTPNQTEAMMIDRLLSYSEPLRQAYHYFHDMMDAFRSKNHVSFIQQLKELPETFDSEFRKKLQSLLNYEEGIRNSIIYPY